MAAQPEDAVLLHGDLDFWIFEARDLPNMDTFSEHLRRFFSPCPRILLQKRSAGPITDPNQPHRRHHHSMIITSDPYVTISIAGATIARTRVISNSQDPIWNEHFNVPVAHRASFIEFQIKDNDVFGAQLIGNVRIPTADVSSGDVVSRWFQVEDSNGKLLKHGSALRLKMQFFPVELNLYRNGITSDPEHKGVSNTYFPLQKGCRVTLYQDAHVEGAKDPEIKLENGMDFEHGKCWEDIHQAISEAQHFIYIMGWSIYTGVRLVRKPPGSLSEVGKLTLGELLKRKSKDGVHVCLLVWDERTSADIGYFKMKGMMGTHDEETRKFFKNSSVVCVLSPRYASSKLSIFRQKVVGNIFSHHQKCVLVDTKAYANKRKITAFIGGLDLCDGRYDTPKHTLFGDLDTIYADDFHNPTFPAAKSEGPRQPWHDLHCRIDGPAAYDILENFDKCWQKAVKWKQIGSRLHLWNSTLTNVKHIPLMVCGSPAVAEDSPSDTWHVQIFRSIDSGSIKGFPETVQEAEQKNLVCEKNLVIDRSIHTAYVKAIRSAKKFIYIENQFFIGSSYAWSSYQNAGANNLVPMELALKIASKIRAGERFAVYIVIPMWPEGDPTSNVVQAQLFWQGQTIRMMYGIIGQELKSRKLKDAHPHDYLNFYCLVNREVLSMDNPQRTQLASSQKFRRFMIYVHSKGMIVDDEYVILGSANINQRSLDGSRDTEIAMGAYQPNHTWDNKKNQHPHGQVYGFRKSLWAEHLGTVSKPEFEEPENLTCVKTVNSIADDNWALYKTDQMVEVKSHIVKYPILVKDNGEVNPIPGCELFPDVGGEVLPTSRSTFPPFDLTT
ncbi:hypothetical protein J5N97_024815 [Dioscorea zingiberensis]|uniref:Phospholipase D n=1 Tax=Dioscorea zingiberensis TaxID=325984 RepID=A0A9D5C7U3_9LILI|nr:hypothetical protein J5N97_024815 [Dioscorea zingiberensis]